MLEVAPLYFLFNLEPNFLSLKWEQGVKTRSYWVSADSLFFNSTSFPSSYKLSLAVNCMRLLSQSKTSIIIIYNSSKKKSSHKLHFFVRCKISRPNTVLRFTLRRSLSLRKLLALNSTKRKSLISTKPLDEKNLQFTTEKKIVKDKNDEIVFLVCRCRSFIQAIWSTWSQSCFVISVNLLH